PWGRGGAGAGHLLPKLHGRGPPLTPPAFGKESEGHTGSSLFSTTRRIPTETGFKLRVSRELTTIERLPVCNLWRRRKRRLSHHVLQDRARFIHLARFRYALHCVRAKMLL